MTNSPIRADQGQQQASPERYGAVRRGAVRVGRGPNVAAQRAAQQHTVQRHGQDEERQQPQDRVTLPDHGGGDERILDKGQSRHVQAGMQVEEKAEVQHVDQQGRAEKESFHPAQNRSRDGAAGPDTRRSRAGINRHKARGRVRNTA